jgi:hypothetical protein
MALPGLADLTLPQVQGISYLRCDFEALAQVSARVLVPGVLNGVRTLLVFLVF